MIERRENKYLSGNEARAWRLARRLSQTELGSWLGISAQAVSKMERRGVSRVVALALAAVDRGLSPAKPTEEDYKVIATLDGDRVVREDSNEA